LGLTNQGDSNRLRIRGEKTFSTHHLYASILPIVSMEIMTPTTIIISDEVKRELLKVAAELQASRREKIDYDDVLRFLVKRATRNLDLFRQACSPTGRSSEQLKEALRKGRAEDKNREQSLKRKYS
jgi:predicted CopG family antitoxin